jgi:septal ring factor EnvC (AmiA/AmiB activator)
MEEDQFCVKLKQVPTPAVLHQRSLELKCCPGEFDLHLTRCIATFEADLEATKQELLRHSKNLDILEYDLKALEQDVITTDDDLKTLDDDIEDMLHKIRALREY